MALFTHNNLDFSKLKHNVLTEMNLSGGSIQTVLDELIYRALEPIMLHSNTFDSQVCYLLNLAATNKKRKISALPRQRFLDILVKYLIVDTRAQKHELLKKAKIERVFLYKFVVKWLERTRGYQEMYHQYMLCKRGNQKDILGSKLQTIERSLGFKTDTLFCAIHTANDYIQSAREFRNAIVAKYLKHAFKEAKKFVDMNPTSDYEFEDVYQNFISAVGHAIDRYDSSKGALTSYINFWLLHERTSNPFEFQYGVAYSIPQAAKRTMINGNYSDSNFSVSMDSKNSEGVSIQDVVADQRRNAEEVIERTQTLNRLKKLAKYADPTGIGRLYLDIDEIFFTKEIRILTKYMKENNIPIEGHIKPYVDI